MLAFTAQDAGRSSRGLLRTESGIVVFSEAYKEKVL